MNNFLKNKKNIYLILIFFTISCSILIKSYFNFNGYITPDSGYFLALADHLINGEGFLISAYEYGGGKNEFFSIWPVGYPLLIFFISELTNLEVFWSSKVVNIILLGFSFLILNKLFKNNAYIYSLVFFFSSYIEILSFTWSENLFLFVIIFFIYSLYKVIIVSNNLFINSFFLFSSCIALFLSRYIGVFSIFVMFLIFIYFLFFKPHHKTKVFFLVIFFNIIFICAYFLNNIIETGAIRGSYDFPIESLDEVGFGFIFSLIKSLIVEFIIPVHSIKSTESIFLAIIFFLLQVSIIILFYFKFKKQNKKILFANNLPKLLIIFIIVGLSYLFFLIFLKILIPSIEGFGFRLLSPFTLILYFAIITYILQIQNNKIKKYFLRSIFLLAFISFLLNVPIKTYYQTLKNPNNYIDNINVIKSQYKEVEKNSIVIFSERMHIRYLRNDIERLIPKHNEDWETFLYRIDPLNNKKKYLKIPFMSTEEKKIYHKSILNKFSGYEIGKVININKIK